MEWPMTSGDSDKRLETLEMTVHGLSGLPAQVSALDARVESIEVQLFQFREEVRDEFSAVRKEIKEESEQTRAEMRTLHEEVISRIKLLDEGKRNDRRR
jgi:uncharacterized coiled-coil protein SlyX